MLDTYRDQLLVSVLNSTAVSPWLRHRRPIANSRLLIFFTGYGRPRNHGAADTVARRWERTTSIASVTA
jgi:hypothetical protein